MDAAIFQEIYRYNAWANQRMRACVDTLSEEQFAQELGHSHGSIRAQCVHIMAVEWWWFRFLDTGKLDFLDEEAYRTRNQVWAQWQKVEQMLQGYLARLDAGELQRKVRPEFWGDGAKPVQVWQALYQVANHSTDHRAQILAAVHSLGGQTAGQDYLEFLHER